MKCYNKYTLQGCW